MLRRRWRKETIAKSVVKFRGNQQMSPDTLKNMFKKMQMTETEAK